MTVLKHLLDKIFFTIGVIVFLQLPHFIDQYTQRIGGYASSERQQLNDFQKIARNNFDGDIQALIDSFKNSSDDSVRQTGNNIEASRQNVEELEQEIQVLENESLFQRTLFLFTNLRYDLAKGTLGSFQPGVPLNLWALLYGLIGGVLFSLIFNGCLLAPKALFKRRKKSTFRTV